MRKKILSVLSIFMILSSLGFILAGPVSQIELIGDNPIYTKLDFKPLLFLNEEGGTIINNPIYFNGDVPLRTDRYSFTGEQIQWKVLAWDKNGVPEKLTNVFVGLVGELNTSNIEYETSCQYLGPIDELQTLNSQGYSDVKELTSTEPLLYGDAETMGEYLCTINVNSNCHGKKYVNLRAIDLDNNVNNLLSTESWFCNPSLDITISGNINFGELSPGQQGYSTFSIQNSAEAGSGVQVVLAVSGTDFYDPSSSGAMCSTSNKLNLQGEDGTGIFNTGFWYSASMGSNHVENKRIPYGNQILQADPIFSSGEGKVANWNMNEVILMSPGSEATMTLNLGIPNPCNGEFTDGDIYLYSWAV